MRDGEISSSPSRNLSLSYQETTLFVNQQLVRFLINYHKGREFQCREGKKKL